MTILNGALWGMIIGSIVGVMVGGEMLARAQFMGRWCQAEHRATWLRYGSILLGLVAGAANTAAMT